MLQEYDNMPADKKPSARRLVSASAATADLYNTYDSAQRVGDVITFTKLKVKRASTTHDLAVLDTLKIKVISVSAAGS